MKKKTHCRSVYIVQHLSQMMYLRAVLTSPYFCRILYLGQLWLSWIPVYAWLCQERPVSHCSKGLYSLNSWLLHAKGTIKKVDIACDCNNQMVIGSEAIEKGD